MCVCVCVCVCYLSHHLVLVGVDEARQTAGQRRPYQLTHTQIIVMSLSVTSLLIVQANY